MHDIMLALEIIRDTLRDIFGRPHAAKNWAMIGLGLAGASLYAAEWSVKMSASAVETGFSQLSSGDSTASFGVSLVWPVVLNVALIPTMIIAFTWTAIAWHRFVLRDALHPLTAALVFKFCLVALPLSLLVGGLPGIIAVYGSTSVAAVELAGAIALYVVTRLSPVLPATATGAGMRYDAAWRLTRPARWCCAWLAVIQGALSWVTGLSYQWFESGPVALTVGLEMFLLIFGIGVVTRLYASLTPSHP